LFFNLANQGRVDVPIRGEDGSTRLEIANVVHGGPRVAPALWVRSADWLAVITVGSPDPADVIAQDVEVVIEFPAPL